VPDSGLLLSVVIATFALMPFQQSIVGESSSLNICLSDLVMALLLVSAPFLWIPRGKIACGLVTVPLLSFLLVVSVSAVMIWHGAYTVMSMVRFLRCTAAAILLFANSDLRLSTARRCDTAFLVGINVLSVCSLYAFATGGVWASMYTRGSTKTRLARRMGAELPSAWPGGSPIRRRVGPYLAVAHVDRRNRWPGAHAIARRLDLNRVRRRLFAVCDPQIQAVLRRDAGVVAADRPGLVAIAAKRQRLCLRCEIEGRERPSAACGHRQNDAGVRGKPRIRSGVDFAYNVDPHNVIVLTLAETGVLGLAAFLALFAGGFATFRQAARFARHDTEAMQVALMGAAVLLVSLVAATMDVYWRRGVGCMSWCGVGLAVVVSRLGRAGMLKSPDDGQPPTANHQPPLREMP